LLINEIRTSLGWLVTKINALGDGVIKGCHRDTHLSSINLFYKDFFLFLHVMAMLRNLVATIENVTTALGDKMAIMEILFADLEKSMDSFGLIVQHTSRIHNKFILCPKK